MKKKKIEVCGVCSEFPCSKFKDTGKYDSFLTYKKVMPNLSFIKEHSVEKFIEQQKQRMELLETMLKYFNDGRSKSFYCIAATLLSIKDMETALAKTRQKIKQDKIELDDIKTRSKILKGFLNEFANKQGIELKLRKK